MNEQIEIEYKILITKETFDNLIKDYPLHKDYIQTNYYFTHPTLKQKKYMLRIREKNNTYELTLKRPINNHRLETNITLTKQEKDNFLFHRKLSNEITHILEEEGINISSLQQEFSLTTHRYDIELPEGILSFDHNTYLDKEDYELEFEVFNEQIGYQRFLEIIQPYSLVYTHNCPSKIVRVYNALKAG